MKTDVRRIFWFLYVILDEWSRKVVAWRVSNTLGMDQAQGLIDDAVIAEGLLDVPENQRPVVVNDNGKQMKAKAIKQMFVDLGIQQTFAWPAHRMTIRLSRHYSVRPKETRHILGGSPLMTQPWCKDIL